MKKRIFVLAALILLIVGCSTKEEKSSKVKKIDSEQVIALMKNENAVLIDVREQSEYDAGHIENAQLLPLNDIETKAEAMISDKNQAVIVYCRSGNRSAKAANILIALGYEHVYDLGGIGNWKYNIVKE